MARGDRSATPTAVLCGDIHLTPKAPVCREQGEWEGAVLRKLAFITDLGAKYGCPVLCSGDLTHRWYAEKGEQGFWAKVIEIMRQGEWIVVPGNHDLPNHLLSRLNESLLFMLAQAGACRLAVGQTNLDWFSLDCYPWGVESPEDPPADDVTIIHKMVYQGKPPFPGAEVKGSTAKALMKQFPDAKLILTGDNHQTFTEEGESGRRLVNPGSMMRMTADQIDHKPCCFLWYAQDSTLRQVFLPIQQGVVSREHIEHKAQHDARISAFVERLQGSIDMGASFEDNLARIMDENDVSEPVRRIVREAIGERQ